eukprot:2353404-Prymnesium_polylepis.1
MELLWARADGQRTVVKCQLWRRFERSLLESGSGGRVSPARSVGIWPRDCGCFTGELRLRRLQRFQQDCVRGRRYRKYSSAQLSHQRIAHLRSKRRQPTGK